MSKSLAVQLYSLRQELTQDFAANIQELAEIGFEFVEGWSDMPQAPDAIAHLLADHGLSMRSCHLPLPFGEDEHKVMQAIEAYGLQYLVVPWLPPENFVTLDGIQRVCEQINKANALFQNQDVVLGYHNHEFEFTKIDGRTAYDIMIEELDPTIILQVDTYWVQFAGYDPIDLIRRLGNRSPLLHIKDGPADSTRRDEPMLALGQGEVDIEGIIAASGERAHYLIIELDRCATDMMTAIRNSYQYLAARGLG